MEEIGWTGIYRGR